MISRCLAFGSSLSVLVAAAGLSGCSGDDRQQDATMAAQQQGVSNYGNLDARFVRGRDLSVIQISTRDRSVITNAALVLADGTRIAAEFIDGQQDPAATSIGPSLVAPGPRFTLQNQGAIGPVQGMPQTTTVAIGQAISSAEIRLPHPELYEKLWRGAHLEVIEDDGKLRELPAPPPP